MTFLQVAGLISIIANLAIVGALVLWISRLASILFSGRNGLTVVIILFLCMLLGNTIWGLAFGVASIWLIPGEQISEQVHHLLNIGLSAWMMFNSVVNTAVIVVSGVRLRRERDAIDE